jgi:hypothetical protein
MRCHDRPRHRGAGRAKEFTSTGAFTAHSSAIAAQIPRLGALLETPPAGDCLQLGSTGLPTQAAALSPFSNETT